MYKVLKYYGNSQEFEKWLNQEILVKHLTLSQVTSPKENYWIVIVWDPDVTKQKQILLDYAKTHLCKDCLTCTEFGYYCRGDNKKCNVWEYDENAYKRLDHVI